MSRLSLSIMMFLLVTPTGCSKSDKGSPNPPTDGAKPVGVEPPDKMSDKAPADKKQGPIADPTPAKQMPLYKTPAELFSGMPKEWYPLADRQISGTPARLKAAEWLRNNRANHQVEWTSTVKDVVVSGKGDDLTAILVPAEFSAKDLGSIGAFVRWGEPFRFNDNCQTLLSLYPRGDHYGFIYEPVSAAMAAKLKAKTGKAVTLRASIVLPEFASNLSNINLPLYCKLSITPPTVDGEAPVAGKSLADFFKGS